MVQVELWDVASGNRLGVWDTEAELWAVVRDLLAENGPALAADLSVGYLDQSGHIQDVVEGADLIERARTGTAA